MNSAHPATARPASPAELTTKVPVPASWFALFLAAAVFVSVPSPHCFAQADQTTASAAPVKPVSSSHLEQNPVFARLVAGDAGEVFSKPIALPQPTMADGLTAQQQRRVIESVSEPKYDVERFLAPRIEAPHVLNIEHEPLSKDERPLECNRMDLYFVASGDLASVSDPDFLSQVFDIDPQTEESKQLSAEELAQAGIDPATINPQHESFSRVAATIFERIELSGVGHSLWSQTEDSILLAVHIDQRFDRSADLAARWERFERQDDGSMKSAETGAYPGAGAYLKITRLEEPAGRLFIEAHGVLLEPYSWFRGRSLLVSKLPPAVRSQVKEIRRRAAKASRQ